MITLGFISYFFLFKLLIVLLLKKTYHPLSINLITKFVWCDLCKEKINLEFNNPPYIFKSRAKLKQIEVNNSDNIKCIDISINNSNMNIGLLDPFEQTINSSLNATNLIVDDYELINYLDQDTSNSFLTGFNF